MSIIGLGRETRQRESWKALTLSEEIVVQLKMECETLQHGMRGAVFILFCPSLRPKTYITTTETKLVDQEMKPKVCRLAGTKFPRKFENPIREPLQI